jgi:hypothetical protein
MLFFPSIPAFVTLAAIERNVSRYDIECPGDKIPYNCSILSNSENITLTWLVTLPGGITVNFTYDRTSRLNGMDELGTNITSTLNTIINEKYIESIIFLTVLDITDLNGTTLECSSKDLDSERTMVYTNKSSERQKLFCTCFTNFFIIQFLLSQLISLFQLKMMHKQTPLSYLAGTHHTAVGLRKLLTNTFS